MLEEGVRDAAGVWGGVRGTAGDMVVRDQEEENEGLGYKDSREELSRKCIHKRKWRKLIWHSHGYGNCS